MFDLRRPEPRDRRGDLRDHRSDRCRCPLQPVWLDRIIRTVAEELAISIEERRQKLSIKPFAGFDEMTFGDPERLFQAFRNLVVNAIKYTPDGGRIEIGGRKLPGFLEVTVSDNGIGIDPRYHARIFRMFQRLESGTAGGTGMGLAIAARIVESAGGRIWVDSRAGAGATFHVAWPA